MSANTGDFYDGGSSARLNAVGAMQVSEKFDGPSPLKVSGEQNQFAGSRAPKPPSGGTA